MRKLLGKKGVVADYLPWLLIGLAVFVILGVFASLLKTQGFSLIDRIKVIFTGR